MPSAKSQRRPDPRGPLVFSVAALAPGSSSVHARTVPAPADLGSGMARVPEGADLELSVQLEDVAGGILVTGTVTAPLAGECARCLADFGARIQVRFRELFTRHGDQQDEDGYLLDGNLLDIEPALRDALVLELPLSPLCSPDCRGLCSQCGVRLADAPPGHAHRQDSGAWAALRDFVPAAGPRDGAALPGGTVQAGGSGHGTSGPGGSKEQ